jgi:hypothetical protein
MMNLFKAIPLLLLVFSSQLIAETIEQVLPEKQLKPLVTKARQDMETSYTNYAVQFNYCQKAPNAPECGKPYEKLQSRYIHSESIYKSLLITLNDDFKSFIAPPSALRQLATDLYELGYLKEKVALDTINKGNILPALSLWLKAKNLPISEQVYLLQTQLVYADRVQQQVSK